LGEGDEVISLGILHHIDADTAEREAYLRYANAQRRNGNGDSEGGEGTEGSGEAGPQSQEQEGEGQEGEGQNGEGQQPAAAEPGEPPARFEELRANEEFILTVTANGYGKRTSSYEYRVTGRGGQGIANIERSERNGDVVASFPVAD